MSKRFADAADEQRDTKRPKTHIPGAVVPPTDIWSARQLQTLLSFSQDSVTQLRNGMSQCLLPCQPSTGVEPVSANSLIRHPILQGLFRVHLVF